MKQIVVVILLLMIGCSQKYSEYGILDKQEKTSPYDDIHVGLYKNYVLLYDEMTAQGYKKNYFSSFDLNEKKHQSVSLEYKSSIDAFYKAKTDILKYLLEYKEDHDRYFSIVYRMSPFTSVHEKYDLMTFSDNALILIDNFLGNPNHKKIIMPKHFEQLSYDIFIPFYEKYKHLEKEVLRAKYKAFVQELIKNKE